jgi:hypothetical protein
MNYQALVGYGRAVVKRDKVTVHMAWCSEGDKCKSEWHRREPKDEVHSKVRDDVPPRA